MTNRRSSSDEMGGVEDGEPRPAVAGAEHPRDVEGLALAPGLEGGGGEEVVERHHQAAGAPCAGRRSPRAAPRASRRADRRPPRSASRESKPFPARQACSMRLERKMDSWDWSGSASIFRRPSRPGHDARDLVAQVVLGGVEGNARALRATAGRSGRRPPSTRACRWWPRAPSTRAAMSWPRTGPTRETLRPGRGGVGRGRLHVLAISARRLGVDPGLEGRGVELLEEEEQVAEVALRVDGESPGSPGRALPRGGRSPARSCRSPSCPR